MKKRILAFILCAICLAGLVPQRADAAGTEITDAAGLAAMAKDPDGSYVLGADIDMAGVDWVPFGFTGTLDGAGHSLLNLTVRKTGKEQEITVDGNDIEYDTVFAGLFTTIKGATIKDLTLLGPDIRIETDENCFVGMIAGYSEASTVQGCSIEYGQGWLTQSAYMAGVAGVIGFGSGAVKNCNVDVTLVFVDTNEEENCEQFMGGIYGSGFADVTGCTVKIDGYDSVHGYVHDGGLVGMYYVHTGDHDGVIEKNVISGRIRFFEDNWDRRAYCDTEVGEMLSTALGDSTDKGFERDEVYDYDTDLYPEMCEKPEYTEKVVTGDCTTGGYTSHTCSGCGYTYCDAFTLPAHVPGEWEILKEATLDSEGSRRRTCTKCGEVVDEEVIPAHEKGETVVVREAGYGQEGLEEVHCATCDAILETITIPALTQVSACNLETMAVRLRYLEMRQMGVTVLPEDAENPTLSWKSSDTNVVVVDGDGTLIAVGAGTAEVTCASVDGGAEDTCTVTVGYTWWQWIIRTVLLGFLWY